MFYPYFICVIQIYTILMANTLLLNEVKLLSQRYNPQAICLQETDNIDFRGFTLLNTFSGIGPHGPLSYFSFQPVLHDWCNKGCGMCYPVCGMVHIKEPLLLIDKSSLCGSSGFPFSLSEWSLTICLTPYNRR